MLDLLMSLSSDGVLFINTEGQIIRANQSAERIFRYPTGELVGKLLEQLIPDRFIDGYKQLYRDIFEGGRIQNPVGDPVHIAWKRQDNSEFSLDTYLGIGEADGQKLVIASLHVFSERVVSQSERELSSFVLESIGNLVLVSNSAGKIVYVSPSVKGLLGYEPDELLADGWWEMERVSGGDIAVERSYVMQAAGGMVFVDANPYEHRLKHKDGTWRIFMLTDAKGPGDLLIGIGTDITRLKQSEEALRESEARYRLAINVADAVPYSVDTINNKYPFIGEEIERLTGFSVEELTPEVFKSLIQESIMRGQFAGVPAIEASSRVRSGENGGIWSGDYRIITKTGESRWLSDTSFPVVDGNGKFIGSNGLLQDITSRKLVESQLKDQRDLSRQVMNNMGQGLTITNSKNRFEYVNPAFASMLGYAPVELIGMISLDLIVPEDIELFKNAQEQRQAQEPLSCELRLRKKDGGTVFVLITGVYKNIEDPEAGFINVVTDLTERRAIETALRESEESIRTLYNIASKHDTFKNKLQAFLQLGVERYGLQVGILSFIENENYHVVAVEIPDKSIKVGDNFELGKTYSRETLREGGPIGIENASASGWANHPCYLSHKVEAYLGSPVRVAG
ncbi:MAG: PAS domain S-box protein, partial [Chloroflexota bacterium]